MLEFPDYLALAFYGGLVLMLLSAARGMWHIGTWFKNRKR